MTTFLKCHLARLELIYQLKISYIHFYFENLQHSNPLTQQTIQGYFSDYLRFLQKSDKWK